MKREDRRSDLDSLPTITLTEEVRAPALFGPDEFGPASLFPRDLALQTESPAQGREADADTSRALTPPSHDEAESFKVCGLADTLSGED